MLVGRPSPMRQALNHRLIRFSPFLSEAKLHAIESGCCVVQDRDLFAFAKMSDGISKRPIQRAVVGPQFFNRKIAAEQATVRSKDLDSFLGQSVPLHQCGTRERRSPGLTVWR